MPVLGMVTVNMDKTLIQTHAAQLRQFAVDVLGQQDVVDRDRREPVATVKVERLPVHVLAVGRSADSRVMLAAPASAVFFTVHWHIEDLSDVLDHLLKLLCRITQTTAAVALQLSPLKVRSDLYVKVDHLTGSTGSRRDLRASVRHRSAHRARPHEQNTPRRARLQHHRWRAAGKHQVA